ncbi:MAG: aspartate--tRNA ligase [Chitinophagales bacterium]|nr:aspartate--tRNA ligase [Chitinophagales bacterium]
MYRTHHCGELNIGHLNQIVALSGWVQRTRDLGELIFIDLRDRYGITQLAFKKEKDAELFRLAKSLGREFVIRAEGIVVERESKNPNLPTGEIEVVVNELEILNQAKTPPFTIEDETDGGDELRMKYRYLDLRRGPLKRNLELRHKVNMAAREYLNTKGFIEVETPFLIKSTPEGARDFVVPSRMNPGTFYALPQSPQTFKQLLMVAGYDRYYQMVKCFRDEDLRADRQPEFSQIDCEMSFVHQEDVVQMFEGLVRHIFQKVKSIDIGEVPRMTYADAMKLYGSDKPDIRFGMTFNELNGLVQGKGFKVFDDAELVVAIVAKGCSEFTRKQLDALTDFVKRPQVGASGLVYVKYNTDGSLKSSVDKFYDESQLKQWATATSAEPGDLILVLAGAEEKTRKAMNDLRLEVAEQLGLRNPDEYKFLWVVDFPLLEWAEDDQRWVARHHPFTRPKIEDLPLLETNPGAVRASAYDMVLNGTEIGGGSIRIHERLLQEQMFDALGLSKEEAEEKFGFLLKAFEFGAPPHGGLAFGFDRLVALIGGADSIRDFIAFPKNNAGRDVMLDAPSIIDDHQLKELAIKLEVPEKTN